MLPFIKEVKGYIGKFLCVQYLLDKVKDHVSDTQCIVVGGSICTLHCRFFQECKKEDEAVALSSRSNRARTSALSDAPMLQH